MSFCTLYKAEKSPPLFLLYMQYFISAQTALVGKPCLKCQKYPLPLFISFHLLYSQMGDKLKGGKKTELKCAAEV